VVYWAIEIAANREVGERWGEVVNMKIERFLERIQLLTFKVLFYNAGAIIR